VRVSESRRYGLSRFEVRAVGNNFSLKDWLLPGARQVAQSIFQGLQGLALDQAFFEQGLVRATYTAAVVHGVAQRPCDTDDSLFWQFPCRTEGAAWDAHAPLSRPARLGDELHVYLGLPWATWIDLLIKQALTPLQRVQMDQQLQMVGTRLVGLRRALQQVGLGLRVHTVCQHVYWPQMCANWQRLGVTDVWLSHCPPDLASPGLVLHPWALYAVNVEDVDRNAGLTLGKDPAQRTVLASFVGAHMLHYLSDVRLRLRALANQPGFVVRVTDRWHFEDAVYQHQFANAARQAQDTADATVESYNQLLCDSVFALCPAGAGPNTLRLWEALAVGAIPVLLGHLPVLPAGGLLPAVDWDSIVLRVEDDELDNLPQRLRAMPLAERRERQQRGLQAYAMVKAQRCF
jgi:hypothetical protein